MMICKRQKPKIFLNFKKVLGLNCPNCGAQVNLSYFDLIETALSDNPQGTGASTIYRKTLLENR